MNPIGSDRIRTPLAQITVSRLIFKCQKWSKIVKKLRYQDDWSCLHELSKFVLNYVALNASFYSNWS